MTRFSPSLLPSNRGMYNLKPTPMVDLQREKERYPSFDPVIHRDGVIDISSSINNLMREEINDWAERNRESIFRDLKNSLGRSDTAGSPQLLNAIASYTNRFFRTEQPVDPANIIVGNGVSSLLSTLAFNICDPGEAIMVEVPNYGMFESDMTYQNDIRLIHVRTENIHDRFSARNAELLLNAYEDALEGARCHGVTVRAVLICNPCNPLGRCYSKDSLLKIADFCSTHHLHLISDEIYGLSGGYKAAGLDSFTSMLALPLLGKLVSENFHVVSGVSKDFGLSGTRIGWLITRNSAVWKTVRRLATTTWITSCSDQFVTKLLLDTQFLEGYANTLCARLRNRRERVITHLRRIGIQYTAANAGLFIFIDLSKWVAILDDHHTNKAKYGDINGEMQLSLYLLQNGIFLQPDIAFLSRNTGKYRLVYSGLPDETVDLAMNRLDHILSRLS